MINGYKIITLCGSTKFKKEFEEEISDDIIEANSKDKNINMDVYK